MKSKHLWKKLSVPSCSCKHKSFQVTATGQGSRPSVATVIRFLFVCVSHVSVLDVFPVHQHVVPAQWPYLAVAHHHVVLKLFAAVCVDPRGRHGVDAVLREAGHRLSEKIGKRGVQESSTNSCIKGLILEEARDGCDFYISNLIFKKWLLSLSLWF